MADTLTDLVAEVAPLVDSLYGSAVEHVVGRRKAELAGRPPRIAWVPLEERNAPPGRVGGNPRTLGTRELVCVVRVWGPSFADLERLHKALLVATYKVAHGSLLWEGATWPESTGEMTTLGELVDQKITFRLPVVDAVITTEALAAAEHTTGLDGSAEDCGHPV